MTIQPLGQADGDQPPVGQTRTRRLVELRGRAARGRRRVLGIDGRLLLQLGAESDHAYHPEQERTG